MAQPSKNMIMGDYTSGLIPAATTAKTQSRDALEDCYRSFTIDNFISSFVIKALSIYITVMRAVQRFQDIINRIELHFSQLFEEANEEQHSEVFTRYLRRGKHNELKAFHTGNAIRQQLEALAHYFGLRYRSAIDDTPTQAEALHGATRSNYFCTYVI